MNRLRELVLGVIVYLRGEPVIAHALAAWALTAAAHYGIHLDANSTLLLGTFLTGVAAKIARGKVTPNHRVPAVKVAKRAVASEAGMAATELCLIVIATIIVLWAFGVVPR